MTIDILKEDVAVTTTGGLGTKLLIHKPDIVPGSNARSIALSPGTEAYVEIEKVTQNIMNKPYSNVECLSGQHYFRVLSRDKNYDYSTCILDCFYIDIFDECQCGFVEYGVRHCTFADYFVCLSPKIQNFSRLHCHCPIACEETYYDIRASTLEYPSTSAIRHAVYNNWTRQTQDSMKDNLIKLYVFYNSFDYKVIEEIPDYPLGSLLADIGGLLGLFLGASILTVIEMFEFIFKVLYNLLLSYKTTSKIRHKTTSQ